METTTYSSFDTHNDATNPGTLQRLFRYKAWADDELLTTLPRFGDDSPIVKLALKALSHTYVVDRIFAAHLKRQSHEYMSANLDELPTLEVLSEQLRRSDAEYIAYVDSLSRHELHERIAFTFTDGKLGRMSREEMLMHVITHGIGHRGQISAVMLLNGQAPVIDGFTAYLHIAEAKTRRPSG